MPTHFELYTTKFTEESFYKNIVVYHKIDPEKRGEQYLHRNCNQNVFSLKHNDVAVRNCAGDGFPGSSQTLRFYLIFLLSFYVRVNKMKLEN